MECPYCGNEFSEPVEGLCPHCGEEVEETAAGGGKALPPPARETPVCPFEDPALPFWERFLTTFRLTITNPREVFSRLPEGDIERPLIYGLIVSTLGICFPQIWALMFKLPLYPMMGLPKERVAVEGFFHVGVILVSPILALVGLFLVSGIYHLMLMLFGDAERGFTVTFRTVCYASSADLFTIVPLCGGFIAFIWGMVLTIMGAVMAHRTEPWRAILAYFLPVVVCCCMPLLGLLMVGFFAAVANGN